MRRAYGDMRLFCSIDWRDIYDIEDIIREADVSKRVMPSNGTPISQQKTSKENARRWKLYERKLTDPKPIKTIFDDLLLDI